MAKEVTWLASALLALAFASCNENSPSGPSAPGRASLAVGLSSASVSRGESVDLFFTVVNDGGLPLELRATSGCGPDFTVSVGGERVWNYLGTGFCPSAVVTYRIDPGQSLTFQSSWDQSTLEGGSAGAGSYEVTGTIWSKEYERLVSPPAILTVL